MSVTVNITIDRAAAILAGHCDFGGRSVLVDPATLDVHQREALVFLDKLRGQPSEPLDATRFPAPPYDKAGVKAPELLAYPKVAVADLDSLKLILDTHIANMDRLLPFEAAVAVAEKKKAEEEAAAWLRTQQDWLATPAEKLIVRDGSYPGWRLVPVLVPYGKEPLPEVVSRSAELRAIVNERTAVDLKAFIAANGEAEARQEHEKAQRKEQVEAIVILCCTPEQQRRRAAGLLKEAEVLDTYRDQVFEPLNSFPRFQKISRADISAATEEYWDDDAPLEFSVTPADDATAAEFATFEAVRDVAEAAIAKPHKVTLSVHSGGYRKASERAVHRKSILVEVNDGVISLSRRYACPGDAQG